MAAPHLPHADTPSDESITRAAGHASMLHTLDAETAVLVRTGALLTAGDEPAMRAALVVANDAVRPVWIENCSCKRICSPGFPGR